MMTKKLTSMGADKLVKTGVRGDHGDGNGLYLQIAGPNAASWILRFRLHGRRRQMGLGPYSKVTLAAARGSAREKQALIATGIDPIQHRDIERSKSKSDAAILCTVRELLLVHYPEFKRNTWRPRTVHHYTLSMKKHVLPVLGDVMVPHVNRQLAAETLAPTWATSPAMAHDILKNLKGA